MRLWSRFALPGSVDRELRRSGPSVRLNAHATASESAGIIGSLVFGRSESPLPNSDNSSMGVACVDRASAAVASLALVCSSPRSLVACAAGAVHARRTVSPMHAAHSHNSWSDTVSLQGPRGGRGSKREFPVRPKICVLSQRWRQEQIFGPRAVYGSRLQVHFPGGNQAQEPGRSGEVWSHLPSNRRFLVSNSCHLDTDWTSGNQWARRICVEPHGREFGC